MSDICHYCRETAQLRCADCGAPCCWAHIGMWFDEYDASHLLCDDCREEE
jgi:hypothetical protein